jgi:hypothetical protein
MPHHVHVIAVVDFAQGSGEIKYVIPVPAAPANPGQPDGRVRLRLSDANGATVAEVVPPVSLMACDMAGQDDGGGMVQYTIEVAPGAERLELVVGGAVVDTFETGATPAPAPGGQAFSIDDDFSAAGPAAPPADTRPVSYMIQARPVGSAGWQTLAVGSATPDYTIDPNQFGGAAAVDVRVTRNRGFSAEVVSEKRTTFAG